MKKIFNLYLKIANTNLDRIFCIIICSICFFNASYLSSVFFIETENDFKTGYYIGAVNMKNGNGYTNDKGDLITHWPPGYSIYLAPIVSSSIESSMNRIRIANGFLAMLWAFLLIQIFKRTIPKIPPFIPLGFSVLWAPMLAIGNPILSELLFATIITLSVYLLLLLLSKIKTFTQILLSAVYGGIMGFAILTKTLGVPIFLFAIIILAFVWKNVSFWRKATSLFVMIISCGLVVLPWILTFYNYTGQIGFTTASLYSFTDGIKPFLYIEAANILYSQRESWTSLSDILLCYFDTLIKYPLSTIHLILVKSVKCWFSTDSGRFETIMIFTNIPFLILFLIGVYKIIRNWTRKRQKAHKILPIILIVVGYILGTYLPAAVLSLPIFRYMTPIFPFVVLVIFYTLFNPDTNKESLLNIKS